MIRNEGDKPDNEQKLVMFHFGGGDLNLATREERDAFARGRLETATRLVETCAAAIKGDGDAIHSSLLLAVNLLLEASEALPATPNPFS